VRDGTSLVIIKKILERLPAAFAFLASAALTGILVLIVIDVTVRALGYRPPAFTVGVVEYLALYFTMFAAPYLVRVKGHIYIQTLVMRVSGPAQKVLRRVIYSISIAACGLFAGVALLVLLEKLESGDIDMRGINFPGWLIVAPLVFGYAMVSLEFVRALVLDEALGEGGEGL